MAIPRESNGSPQPDAFDVLGMLREVAGAVRHYRWTVVVTCALVLGLVTLYVIYWPPVYVADAMVMIEREEDVARDEFYVNWNVFRKEDARTEIELMKSGPVLKELIETEKLGYDDVYHPPTSHLKYLWETSWPGRKYQDLKDWIFASDDKPYLTPEQIELGRTLKDLAKGVSIRPVGESNIGEVVLKGPSPRVAQMANSLVDIYMKRRTDRYVAEAQAALDTLTSELDRAEAELKAAEEQRRAFFEGNRLSFSLEKEIKQIEQLTGLEAQMAERRRQIAEAEAALAVIERQITEHPERLTIASVEQLNSVHETARQRRLELELSLIQAREQYREDSPEVQEIQRMLARTEDLLKQQPQKLEGSKTQGLSDLRQKLLADRNALLSELQAHRAGLEQMQETADHIQVRLDQVPALQMALNRLDRDQGLLLERHRVLALRRAQAEVSLVTVQTAMPSMRVVAYAIPPSSKSWPTMKIVYPVALLVGLVLGAMAAVIRQYSSGRVRRADLHRRAGHPPIYGEVAVPTRGRSVSVRLPRLQAPVETTTSSKN